MTNLEFMDFQAENCGRADKYIDNKMVNEEIYMKNDIKKTYSMKDWKNHSENILMNYCWDVATGEFVPATRLNKYLGMKL